MRVLATNCALRERSGTEIVTIDLALGLSRRGHGVAVLSPMLGRSADILRDRAIVVTDRIEDLPWTPDVIHGHHNNVLAAALAAFPDVPALFVCHTSTYWFDGPPPLSRVRRFCAVDEACRARLAAEAGCGIEAVELLPNAVDLEQFAPRAPLPDFPRRALLLTKNTEHIAAVRTCAGELGLELDEIGHPFGRLVDDLHARLTHYDVVFATARSALEALAVGCAVVVVDGRGLAGLVTSQSVDEWRRNNFGLRLLTRPPTAEALVAEVRRYDAQDATRVSLRIREVASLALYLDRVEAIHRDIVAAPRPASDHARELRALGRFLMQWLRRLGEGTIPENFDVLVAANKFAAEHQAMVAGATAMSDDNAALREQMGRLNEELKLVRHDFAAMHRANLVEVEALSNDNAVLRGELDVLRRELATLNRLHRSPHKLMRFYGGAIYRRIVGLGGN